MPKHVLKTLDQTALLIALDHAEEFGLDAVRSDPDANPDACVYLAYIGDEQLHALAARLPHVEVLFRMPGSAGRNRVFRKVFSGPAVWHVLRFAFPDEGQFAPFVRDLGSVDRKYWRVLPAGNNLRSPPVGRSSRPSRRRLRAESPDPVCSTSSLHFFTCIPEPCRLE